MWHIVFLILICCSNNSFSQSTIAHPPPKIYVGKRISLNFQNINIRALLQMFADFTELNLVISDHVQGEITLRLNHIPWDQALDIILTTQHLVKHRKGNILFIDSQAFVEQMKADELKKEQNKNNLSPVHSELLQINYAKASDIAGLIKDKHNAFLSEKGALSVDTRTNTVWIQDVRTNIKEVKRFIRQLDVPVKQVLIEARIVEVSKDFSRDLGIRWGISKATHLSGTLQGAHQSVKDFAPPNEVPLNRKLNLDLVAAPVSGLAPASVGVAFAKLGNDILLDLELSALESEGHAELISNPRLITTNQQPAIIESGEEIPYQESTLSGATSVSFKKAVLSLKVTPHITPDSKILMDLQINQDTPSAEKFNGVPAIYTKEVQTNVLINNGETIVLGGIYKQGKNKAINRIPFLGSLPVVGALFRNKQVTIKNEELLIFITPRIIINAAIDGDEKEVYK